MSKGVLFSRFLESLISGLLFKNAWEKSTTKNFHCVSLFCVLSKVFEKLLNNRFVNYLQKCDLLSDFQYGFTGLSINILHVGDKSPMQRGFFNNSAGDLLPTSSFLGGLYNFCIFVIFSLM